MAATCKPGAWGSVGRDGRLSVHVHGVEGSFIDLGLCGLWLLGVAPPPPFRPRPCGVKKDRRCFSSKRGRGVGKKVWV